ncbi:DUF4407 domain-containing protein [Actinokineospora soli]|uniref:DUF4407 domain-containing protein n=1 Tax=Actinokineospora soli TaxID=1048753 RepID=A0ABW2TJY2_9PSEU
MCAGALAVVSTSAVAVPVFAGFGLRSWLFPLVLVVFFVVFLPANLLAEKFVRANRWSGGLPAWRLALAVLVGVVVAYAGLLWSYSARIQAVSEPVPAAERAAETRRLEAERADLRGVAARVPVPPAEDPEVRRFRAELAEARRLADEARRRELCELDGTCGTGDDGIGEAYRERKEYRQELDRRVAELTRGHDAAVRAAEQRARDVEAEADRARTRIDEIDDRLADLALSDPRAAASSTR